MKTIVLLLALLLSGCASVGEGILKAGTTGDVRFKAADVDVAIKIAQQAQDALAEACFKAIRKHVDQEFKIETVGPVSAYAAARVRIKESRAGLSPEVHTACAPLVIDAGTFTSRLGLTFGGSVLP